jgi:hypothetical protein
MRVGTRIAVLARGASNIIANCSSKRVQEAVVVATVGEPKGAGG